MNNTIFPKELEDNLSPQMDISQAAPQRFEIISPLSSGAQAKAYLARDMVSGQQVFLKKLNATQLGDWKTWELFQRESQTLQKLDHPQIPAYIDSFQDEDGNFCLVQKYIGAPSIAKLLTEQRIFQSVEVIDIGLQVLQILDYLKNCNPPVVHRDIKPSNILYGNDKRVHLVDFGLVAAASDESERGSTIAGTAGYMAPEQLMGNSEPASDIFGLFTTLLHLLTGTPPSSIPTVGFNMEIRPYLRQLPYDLVLLFEECLEPLASKRQSDIPYITRELLHIKDILQNKSAPKPWPDNSHDLAPRKIAQPSKIEKLHRYSNPIKTLHRSRYYSPLKPGLQYFIPDNNEFTDAFRDCRNQILQFERTFLGRAKIVSNVLMIAIFVLFILLPVFWIQTDTSRESIYTQVLLIGIGIFLLLSVPLLSLPLARPLMARYFRKNVEKPLQDASYLSDSEKLIYNLTLITEANTQTATIQNIECSEMTAAPQKHYRVTLQTPHPRKPAESLILQKTLALNSVDPSLNIGDEVPIRIDNNGEQFVFFPGPFFE